MCDIAEMTRFRKVLKELGLNINRFAKMHGYSAGTLYDFDSGRRTPSLETARDITVQTGGRIPMDYWLNDDPSPPADNKPDVADSDKMASSQ